MNYKRLTNNNRNEYDPEYDFCCGCQYFGEPCGCNRPNGTCDSYDRFLETYNRLSELEDKIENGTLVELPCKVGDTVYYDTYLCGKNVGIKPHKVSAVRIMVDAEKLYVGSVGAEIPEWEFGKSVFYTREEAEAEKKLEELKNE